MSQMPYWIQIVQAFSQALLLPMIAIGAGLIAFLQWRTAHQRVVMDLFDRRLEIYNSATALYREIVRNGLSVDMNIVVEFHAVRNKARFLFGKDMTEFLKEWHEDLIDMSSSAAMMRDIRGPDRQAHVETAHRKLKSVIRFGDKFPEICARYMRMDQRAI